MKNHVFAFLAFASIGSPAFSADSYTVDPRHTFPSFEINHLGFSIQRGRFDETAGKVTFDAKSGNGSIQIRINPASISTGLADLEKHLRGEDFFDAARFPEIVFNSDRLTFVNEKLTGVDGFLTMHGETRPVHLSVDHFHCAINMINLKNVCGANATTTIKRSDFGIDKYAPALADDVRIEIQIEAIKD